MSPRKPYQEGAKKPSVEKRATPVASNIKTIGYNKLKDELGFVETTFARAERLSPLRPRLEFQAVKDVLLHYYRTKDVKCLLAAEVAIRSYLIEQDDVSKAIRNFIEKETEAMFQGFIGNKNRDAKRLDGLSPGLLIEKFNEESPPNINSKEEEVHLSGDMKRAYFSLSFISVAIELLLENKIAPAALSREWKKG